MSKPLTARELSRWLKQQDARREIAKVDTAIDLFAGLGGCTLGAKKAGVKVLWAANHSKKAVYFHQKNHPETEHACQDLSQFNFTQCPDHQLLIGSPCCYGFSKARGKDRPWHDDSRATVWAVVSCLDVKRPPFFIVENVTDFRRWEAYEAWQMSLKAFGYRLSEHVINSADLGVPQSRERLFIVGVHKRISDYPIFIPQPQAKHKGARTILGDFPDCWSRVDKSGRATDTLMRIEQGRKRFGRKPFLLAYYGNEQGGRSLDEPLGTVTRKDRFGLVDGKWLRMLQIPEYRRAMAFPDNYNLPDNHKLALELLGNAVVPQVLSYIIHQIRRFVCPVPC